jgi:hypothetical protein
MRNKNVPVILSAVGLTALSLSASAQVTLSDGQLQGLDYTTSGNAFNGVFPSAQYVPTGPTTGYADLTSPDGNNGPTWAMVSVPNGYDGVQLGTLASLDAAGAAGQVGFDLSKLTGLGGNSAFWEITLTDPTTGTPFTLVSIGADPDKPGGVPFIGENYYNEGNSMMAYTSPQLGNVQALWSVVEGYTPDGSGTPDLGTWDVQSVGVEIGIWGSTAAGEAQIDSFTLPGTYNAPDAGSTLSLLGICFGALAGLHRRLNRA